MEPGNNAPGKPLVDTDDSSSAAFDQKDTFEGTTSSVPSKTLLFRLEEARRFPPSLVMLMGPAPDIGRRWSLDRSEMLIGRATEAGIVVADRSVSKFHASLETGPKGVFVTDLGSTNGTFLGELRLDPQETRRLEDGAHLHIGNVIFKFLAAGNIESFSHQTAMNRAQTDDLTGVLNKGALMNELEEACRRAALMKRPLSFILFDLDNFKEINDESGHTTGDAVLRDVCAVLRHAVIRSSDTLGRFGGDEFAVILNETPLVRALEVAERVRAVLDSHDFIVDGQHFHLTASLGVGAMEEGVALNACELFQLADQAAYVSKRNGKNRVSA